MFVLWTLLCPNDTKGINMKNNFVNIDAVVENLAKRELRLLTLLFDARTALLREWMETGSYAAKCAYDATDPKDVI
jgi:hypothetical protein